MSGGKSVKPSEEAARHDLAVDSSSRALDLGHAPDRHLRSQRWRSDADPAAKDDISQGTRLDALHWEPLTAIPKTPDGDVPDLDWLLDLNNLAQMETLPSHALAWPIAPLQVMLPDVSIRVARSNARRGLVVVAY